uniref:Uncharacterized protein n=1 Tax=Timema cristinae TaxID=61476 RepID=A0A7R9GR75_TIMCR|nr:unnamed protein product [Timema cristinae]
MKRSKEKALQQKEADDGFGFFSDVITEEMKQGSNSDLKTTEVGMLRIKPIESLKDAPMLAYCADCQCTQTVKEILACTPPMISVDKLLGNKFIIETSFVPCEDLIVGRLSFQGMNPVIERIMQEEEDAKRKKVAPKVEADVSDNEMAHRYSTLVGTIGRKQQEKGGEIVHTSQPATQNTALRHYAVTSQIFLVADWMSIVAMQWFTILRPLLEHLMSGEGGFIPPPRRTDCIYWTPQYETWLTTLDRMSPDKVKRRPLLLG